MKKEQRYNQALSFVLILFLICSVFISCNSINAQNKDNTSITLYVDDDNIDGPWDGTIDHPFQRINDAVAISNDNNKIFVFSGIYEESLFINKYVNITGEHKLDTKLLGSIIIQDIDHSRISHFTITQISDRENKTSGIIINNSQHIIITDTIITNHYTGMLISQLSQFCIIKENTISNNEIGLDVCTSSNNLIYANNIEENQKTNMILYHSNDNHISQNIIKNAKYNLQFHTSKDTITNNYWGNAKQVQIFIGYRTIPLIDITIPWIKILFTQLTSEDQQQIYPIALMKTSLGTMQLELYTDKLPITSKNFIDLCHIDFFDGLVFHRIIDNFVIQGGGYDVNGTRNDSPFGTIPLETHSDVQHVKGAISMARTSDPDSATSQFFICDDKLPHLDGEYAAFGKLLIGFNTLDTISQVETTRKHFMDDWPVEEVVIQDVLIV